MRRAMTQQPSLQFNRAKGEFDEYDVSVKTTNDVQI